LSIDLCWTKYAPVWPNPEIILTTPSGSPDFWSISQNFIAVKGVCYADFNTIVHPAASAGASFQLSIINGKFQGMTWPTTPTGYLVVIIW
jgi:hypothetical protein